MVRPILALLPLAFACRAPPDPAALDVGVAPTTPTTRDTVYATLDGAPLDDGDAGVRWVRRSDGRVVTGAALPAIETARYDVWDVEVVRGGVTGRAQVAVFNSAPEGFVTLPSTADATAPLTAALFVEDADDDPVDVRWRWQRDGAWTEHEDGAVPATALARGQRWVAEATLRDDAAATVVTSTELQIEDAPPTLTLTFDPTTPDATTGLRAVLTASDADGDAITTALGWFRNGVPVVGAGDRPPLPLARGEVWSAVATASDGTSSTEVQATIAIGNAAPTVSGARIAPSEIRRDLPPRCEVEGLADPDGDAVSATLAWDVDGIRWSTPTLDPARYARGQLIRCIATPFDGDRVGEEAVSPPVQVANTPPALLGASLSPIDPTIEDAVAIVPAGRSDADGDTVGWSATWWLDGVWLHEGLYLPAGLARRGGVLTATVTPNDGIDDGLPVTAPGVVVVNAAPTILLVTADPSPPRPDVDWVIDVVAVDPDADPWTPTATFTIDGVVQPQTDTLRLPRAALVGAQTVEVTVWVSDGEQRSAPWTLGPVAVGNGRPAVDEVAITPATPTARDALTCLAGAVSDPEGDPADVAYAWKINGRPAYAGPTLPAGLAARGDVVTCEATAGDAGGVGRPTAASVILLNTVPVLLGLDWSVDPLVDGAPLDVLATVDDPDLDAMTLERTWTVRGVTLTGDGGPLGPAQFARADEISVHVRVFDGQAWSAPVSLGPASVANAPPSVTVTLTPDPITAATGARAVVDVTDPDGDATTWATTWTLDGLALPDVGPSLPGLVLRRGATLQATVTAIDALGATTAQAAPPVVIDNAPPAGAVHLSPSRPIAGMDALRCVPEGDRDADGDGVTWTVAWTRNGASWPAEGDALGPSSEAWTGDTIPAAALQVADAWACAATPYDVEGPGEVVVAETSPWQPATRTLKAGGGTTCAILPNGTPRCWGDNALGQAVAPTTTLTDLSVGYDAVIGLRPDGRLIPWGDPLLVGVPGDRFAQVAVGDDHACGRTLVGTAKCWGFDIAGRTQPPPGTYVDLTVGIFHGCGILDDGTGVCWGDDSFGQSTPPPGVWRQVVAGDLDTCWRDDAGNVQCVGLDSALQGPLGAGWADMAMGSAGLCLTRPDGAPLCVGAAMPPGAPERAVDRVALGVGFGCARAADDGSTVCWGEEPHGAAWPPDPVDAVVSGAGVAGRTDGVWRGWGPAGSPPSALTAVWALSGVGGLGVDAIGAPVAWGAQTLGPPPSSVFDPSTCTGGASHIAALSGGVAVAWGTGPALASPAPAGVWTSASAAANHTLLLDAAGDLACWGDCIAPPSGPWTLARAGEVADCGLDGVGALVCWGGASWGLTGSGFVDLAVSRVGGCALRTDGSVACFGGVALPADIYVALFGATDGVCGWTATGDLRCRGAFAR